MDQSFFSGDAGLAGRDRSKYLPPLAPSNELERERDRFESGSNLSCDHEDGTLFVASRNVLTGRENTLRKHNTKG
jgi:hypothetical protein